MYENGSCDWEDIEKHNAGKHFVAAVKEVVSTMAGFDLKEDATGERLGKPSQKHYTGGMFLPGSKNMFCTVSMPLDSLMVLVSYMTGIPPSELKDEDLNDGIAELINIVSGNAKSFLAETEYSYKLTSPFSIQSDNHQIIYKGKAKKLCKRFLAGNLEIYLTLVIL